MDLNANQAADHAVAVEVRQLASVPANGCAHFFPECQAAQRSRLQQASPQPVIQVVRGVGQLVCNICNLRLEAGAQFRVVFAGVCLIVFRLMFDEALAHFPSEIEAAKIFVALLQCCDDAQRLAVVIEVAVRRHQALQHTLAGVAKWRVAQIMRKADGFHQILIGAERAGDAAPQLRHFQGVREARAIVVAFAVYENLRLVFKAAKCGGVQYARPVALEASAVLRFGLRVQASL